MSWFLWAGETDGGTTFDISPVLNVGAVGVLLILTLWYGKKILDSQLVDLRAQRDKLQEQNDSLNEDVREKFIPALVAATEAIKASNSLSEKLADLVIAHDKNRG